MRWKRLISACHVVACFTVRAQSTAPTSTVVLSDQQSCATCRIARSPLLRVPAQDDTALLVDWPTSIDRDSKGNVALGTRTRKGLPLLFDSRGVLRRKIGRDGSGPGEYLNSPFVQFDDGDSLHIIDQINLRHTILTPDGRVAASIPFPGHSVLLRLNGNRRMLMSGTVPTPDGIGRAFHTVSGAGLVERSFGEVGGPVIVGQATAARRLSRPQNGTFWEAELRAYRINQWSESGKQLASFERKPSWFPIVDRPSGGLFGTEPTPQVMDVHADADGLVWVVIAVAARNWRSALGTPVLASGATTYPSADQTRLFDTVIEVLDPRSRRVVVSSRVTGFIKFLLPGLITVTLKEDADGIMNLQLDKLSIQGRR